VRRARPVRDRRESPAFWQCSLQYLPHAPPRSRRGVGVQVFHIDETHALDPLETSSRDEADLPETYPTAL